jgi:hypothetical protein
MRKYEVKIQVNYVGDIEANSEAEAEQMAWSAYYGSNATLEYDSVESIEVDEYEYCEECDNADEDCECEPEEVDNE